jgi:fumarate reductase flavoprotein subunit
MESARKISKKNLQADIVVMGSGGGLAAAVTAAEAGARVILLEKEGTPGGYTRQANGLMACESPVQKRQNITITRDEVFRRFMNWAHCRRVNPRVVRAFINKTGDTIQWLEKKGVEFELMTPPGGLPIVHMPVGRGAAVQKALLKKAKDLGVNILLRTSGKKIIRGAKGNVTGVVAVKDREEFQIKTKSVIIATGGFGDNRELLKKYCPDYYDGMPIDYWPHHSAHSGDGLLMAEEIGAAIADSVPNYHIGPYYPPCLYPWQSLAAMAMNPCTIWVNKRGRRFIDEAGSLGTGVSGNAILLQPDKVMYTVFDDEIRKIVEEGRPGLTAPPQKHAKRGGGTMISNGTHPGLKEELQKETRKGGVKISDSWDEIAKWIGADPKALKAEIDEYNSYCDKGHDDIFTKEKKYLQPLRKAPYYAMKCYARVGETLGGIKVNERMEVLDKKENTIPGVYAAGVIADGFEPEDYNREIPGCAMGFAVNSGRIAGESAARFISGK